jgi:hypothetical protein
VKRLVVAIVVVVSACAGVLGLTRSGPQAFPHRKHTIAGIPCTQCHPDIAQNDGKLHIPTDTTCVSCHAKPHDTRSCLGCHAAAGALETLAESRDHILFQHDKHLGEVHGNCVHCHVGIADGDDHLRPPMATCFKCHDHDAARDARNCNACHRGLDDTTTLPQSHLVHEGDWMREHGTRAASSADLCQTCHREKFCADCHGKTVPILPATAHFANPFASSVHRAGFGARHALEARAEPGACSTCHTPDRCATCHLARGVSGDNRRNPHPAGWVGLTAADNLHGREARRDPSACASCHDGAGQQLCISCHKVGGVGGNPHPAGWSSKVPLGALPCRLCHPLGSRP